MGGVKGIGAGIAKGIAEDFQSGSHSIFVLQARTGSGKLDGGEWEATFVFGLVGVASLIWTTEIDGKEVRYYKEPETSFGQRFMSGFIEMLPVEHQL